MSNLHRLIRITSQPTLWYENASGEKRVVTASSPAEPPAGFVYQHTQFPNLLSRRCLRFVQADEVANCEHPKDFIRPTYGWVDGIKGRECTRCDGTQTTDAAASHWPKKWEANGSREVITTERTWPMDLVLALVRPTVKQRLLGLARTGQPPPRLTMSKAILTAANTCERCVNALAYACGLKWGYAEGSDEYRKVNTSCYLCDGSPR